MLDINDITLRFAGRLLFNGASAHISDGQRVGLTGRNGTGKTTLFRLILGELASDDGDITITKGHRIATVAQEIPDGDLSLLDCVLKADTERTALLAIWTRSGSSTESRPPTGSRPNTILSILLRLLPFWAICARLAFRMSTPPW